MKIPMVIDDAGEAFIRGQEGCKLYLYDDINGNCTIAVGHLVHHGATGTNPVAEEPYVGGCTDIQANELLMHDVAQAEEAVNSYVTVPLTQGQFNALVDFCFNEGSGRLMHSTLLELLNHGLYDAVPAQLQRWVYSGGEKSTDLIRRRAQEEDLWNKTV